MSIYRNNTVVNLGTMTDDYIQTPEIFTTAVSKETGEQETYAAERAVITDTVYYSGLQAGQVYTVKGALMDQDSGQPLESNGQVVTGEKTFRATGESGTVTMDFAFDGRELQGKSLVVFEALYQDGQEITSHRDMDDGEQTITFVKPEISTTATGENGEKELLISDEVKIKDTIAYKNLLPNKEYAIKGSLMDKESGEAIPGSALTASFTPEQKDGAVYVTFTVDARELAGREAVAFEKLFLGDVEIAKHEDLMDEGQTVRFANPPETPVPTPPATTPPTITPPVPTPPSTNPPQTGVDDFPWVCMAVIGAIALGLGIYLFVIMHEKPKKK